MSVTHVITEEDRWMLSLLRELGLEEQVRQYERLLHGELPFAPRPAAGSAPVPGAIPVAEAAARLALSRQEIQRYLEVGLLTEEPDPDTGEPLVTNASIAKLVETKRNLAAIVPFSWEAEELTDPNSLLGQMLAANRREEEDDAE
jgi:hypothetical protein